MFDIIVQYTLRFPYGKYVLHMFIVINTIKTHILFIKMHFSVTFSLCLSPLQSLPPPQIYIKAY